MGFTLIEALAVTAVIGIISSIMVVNWRKNEERYKLQRAAQEIVQNIRKAQDYALTGKKMYWEPWGTMEVPRYYGLHLEEGEQTYFIYGDMQGNTGYQNPEDIEETYTQIENGIEIDSLSDDPLDLIFSIPDGFVGFNDPSADNAVIIIKRTGNTCPSTYCRTITIEKTGEITIQ